MKCKVSKLLTDKLSHDLAEVQVSLGVLGSGLLGPGLENIGIELAHFGKILQVRRINTNQGQL
jgi:hypothetical protein